MICCFFTSILAKRYSSAVVVRGKFPPCYLLPRVYPRLQSLLLAKRHRHSVIFENTAANSGPFWELSNRYDAEIKKMLTCK